MRDNEAFLREELSGRDAEVERLRCDAAALRAALDTAQRGCGSAINALINRDSNTEGLFETVAVTAIADAEAGYKAARAALGEAAT